MFDDSPHRDLCKFLWFKEFLQSIGCILKNAERKTPDEPSDPAPSLPEVKLITPSPEVVRNTGNIDTPGNDSTSNLQCGNNREALLNNNLSDSLLDKSIILPVNLTPSDNKETINEDEPYTDTLDSHIDTHSITPISRSGSMSSLSSMTSKGSIQALQNVVQQKAYELKASLAFFIVALLYMLTWLPVVALTFTEIVDLFVPHYVEIASLYTIALNALIDPFVYGLLLPSFRDTLKLLLRRKREKLLV